MQTAFRAKVDPHKEEINRGPDPACHALISRSTGVKALGQAGFSARHKWTSG